MNKAIFASMREQMAPSEAAQAALWERLEAEPIPQKKKRTRMKPWKPLALAACAAFAIGLYSTLPLTAETKPHSYITLEAGDPAVKTEYRQETTAQGVDRGGEEEEGPNTGDLPGGAYIGEVPVQLGADAYQLLMDHFGGAQPDWYGGAYVTDAGSLMVLLVEDRDPGDKTLELEVMDAVGDLPVGFTSAKYSRNDLERLNGELLELLEGKGIPATWGIYDDQNRIVLDVSEPPPDDLLSAIGALDPEDDAILIRVVEDRPHTDELAKGPAPIEPVGSVAFPNSGTVGSKEEPAVSTAVPGVMASDDGDPIAVEPQIKDLPEELPEIKGVKHDLLPVEKE